MSVEILLKNGDLELVQDGNHGGSYPKIEEFVSDGVPLITGACLADGCVDYTKAGFISPSRASQLRVGFAQPGDVLLTHKGTMGKTAIVPESRYPTTILNPQITLYRVAKSGRLQARYLRFFFDSQLFQRLMVQISATSTINTLPIKEQKKLEIPVPSQETQDYIVGVLGSLDDRIALLRETNATLEAIAQALFKSWFVDFDPVHARARGEEPAGLSPEVAALFPNSFEESELGMIPKGWRVGELGQEVRISYGKNLPTTKLLDAGFPVYGGNGQIGFFDSYLYKDRQVLVACRGAASGKVNQSVPEAFITNNSLVLESTELLTFSYLKGFMTRADLTPYVTGSAQPQVTIDNLKNFKILVPPQPMVAHYEAFAGLIENRIEGNCLQAQSLATLRDTLLPRLISGQLRLPEAEAMVEAVS